MTVWYRVKRNEEEGFRRPDFARAPTPCGFAACIFVGWGACLCVGRLSAVSDACMRIHWKKTSSYFFCMYMCIWYDKERVGKKRTKRDHV